MASLSVRKIDADVYERLRIRAAQHGVSMEEEVRQILKRVVAAPAVKPVDPRRTNQGVSAREAMNYVVAG